MIPARCETCGTEAVFAPYLTGLHLKCKACPTGWIVVPKPSPDDPPATALPPAPPSPAVVPATPKPAAPVPLVAAEPAVNLELDPAPVPLSQPGVVTFPEPPAPPPPAPMLAEPPTRSAARPSVAPVPASSARPAAPEPRPSPVLTIGAMLMLLLGVGSLLPMYAGNPPPQLEKLRPLQPFLGAGLSVFGLLLLFLRIRAGRR